MHLCPDCQEYCACHHDTDLTMYAAPADCRHLCDAAPLGDFLVWDEVLDDGRGC
jgi:hypothetical protein